MSQILWYFVNKSKHEQNENEKITKPNDLCGNATCHNKSKSSKIN